MEQEAHESKNVEQHHSNQDKDIVQVEEPANADHAEETKIENSSEHKLHSSGKEHHHHDSPKKEVESHHEEQHHDEAHHSVKSDEKHPSHKSEE